MIEQRRRRSKWEEQRWLSPEKGQRSCRRPVLVWREGRCEDRIGEKRVKVGRREEKVKQITINNITIDRIYPSRIDSTRWISETKHTLIIFESSCNFWKEYIFHIADQWSKAFVESRYIFLIEFFSLDT